MDYPGDGGLSNPFMSSEHEEVEVWKTCFSWLWKVLLFTFHKPSNCTAEKVSL